MWLVSAPNQTSPLSLPWPVLNETEPIYTTHYALMDIPHNVAQYWGTSEAADLWLPQANQFIPQDIDILPAPQDVKDTPEMVELNDSMCQHYSYSIDPSHAHSPTHLHITRAPADRLRHSIVFSVAACASTCTCTSTCTHVHVPLQVNV